MELHLVFGDGAIVGEGMDMVGLFTVSGRYVAAEGGCNMIKRYTHGPDIRWDGWHFGEVVWIAGVWKLPHDTGWFYLRPAGKPSPESCDLSDMSTGAKHFS
jgi:hypothetical protein